jgi:SAM-dependent methyltransferase
VRSIAPIAGADLWAATYDDAINPLLALEARHLEPLLITLKLNRILDAACGTGRWMKWAARQGIAAFGTDASMPMLRKAIRGARTRACRVETHLDACTQALLTHLPFRNASFDLAICSFALSYVPDPIPVLAELARVASLILISDMHPETNWSRSFKSNGQTWELEHSHHTNLRPAGLRQLWQIEPHFGEPERPLFIQAGKAGAFDEVRRIPAIRATLWQRI